MLNYEICYTDRRGALVGKISAECASRTHAAVLAHAMKFRKWLGVEVWDGERLIYERPTPSLVQSIPALAFARRTVSQPGAAMSER